MIPRALQSLNPARLPLIASTRARIGRRRVRRIMRGYATLKRTGRLGMWAALRDEITNTPIGRVDRHSAPAIFGIARANAEIVVRQYLLLRVMGLMGLNASLLYSLGNGGSPIVHPLPREWRLVLRDHGFQVSEWRCALVWQGYVVLLFGYGVLSTARQLLRSVVACVSRRPHPARFVLFEGLGPASLPQPSTDGRSHDIISWYLQWNGRVNDLEAVEHTVAGVTTRSSSGVPIVPVRGPLPPVQDVQGVGFLSLWAVRAVALCIVDLLRGRWWHPLLLREASIAALARAHQPRALAREYLFHNSNAIYRPMWTYETEAKGSLVSFYFYSTNNEPFKRPDGYPLQPGSWQMMRWPRYLVWDEFQAEFVRRATGPATICVVGPIWFQTSSKTVPPLSQNCVAVFDVQPQRSSRYRLLGLSDEYYTPRTANAFLRDIHTVVAEVGATMALKRKRHIGSLLHPAYAATVASLANHDNCALIDADISAVRLIEVCAAVISMPFTSPSLLGRHACKPSIYYDPHGVVQKDDRAAHGIPIVSGISELRRWFEKLAMSQGGRVRARELRATTVTATAGATDRRV